MRFNTELILAAIRSIQKRVYELAEADMTIPVLCVLAKAASKQIPAV